MPRRPMATHTQKRKAGRPREMKHPIRRTLVADREDWQTLATVCKQLGAKSDSKVIRFIADKIRKGKVVIVAG